MLRQVLGYFDIRTSNILTVRLVHEAVQMKNFAGVSLMGHIQCFAGLAAALLSVLCRPGYNVLVRSKTLQLEKALQLDKLEKLMGVHLDGLLQVAGCCVYVHLCGLLQVAWCCGL